MAAGNPLLRSIQRPLRLAFALPEKLLDRVFPGHWNPLYNLGALGFFMYWIVAGSGIYLYIFFDTGLTEAYQSVEYMTNDQWYLAGVMRSLHRYASDAMVLFMVLHVMREFALDHYRGSRWFSWITGAPVIVLLIVSGITGYWLVWDRLAQYIAIKTTEFFDWLPIFGVPIAANFVAPESLDDRFFSLMIFLHIAAPLFLLFALWIHLARIAQARSNPPRGLAAGITAALLALSLVKPAVSHAPADLSTMVTSVNLDWFYLGLYPLVDMFSAGAVWGALAFFGLTLMAMPWMPPLRRPAPAEVHLEHCNGCRRCVEDCPYEAVAMQPRSDGASFDLEAVVNPDLCVSCGICSGACPSSMPFRRRSDLVSGIELPDFTIADLRNRIRKACARLSGDVRILLIGCNNAARVERLTNAETAAVSLPCSGMLPPPFIDYVLARGLADGVFITGCREGACYNRLGQGWTNARIDRQRDPHLRRRVPRERIARCWAGPLDDKALAGEIGRFAARLRTLPAAAPRPAGPPPAPGGQKAAAQ